MRILWFIFLFVYSLNAEPHNKELNERMVKMEVQMNQLEDMIDSRSGLLKEKQEIFVEHEKRLNGLNDKCDLGLKKIDDQISSMDEKFRGLYSEANYGIIAIAIALILAIIFVCNILNKSLTKLEDNYKNQINDITSNADRKINAIIRKTDTQIRKYQSVIDAQNTDEDDEEEDISSSNPF